LKEIKMKNSTRKRIALGTLAFVLLIGLAIAVLNAGSYIKEKDSYVEVGGGKIAYVPRTAQFVKVNGQVRRIVKFSTALSAAEKDCKCPKCCDGHCYIIVFSDAVLTANPIIILSVIWMSCT
jgi:hypothetical protein